METATSQLLIPGLRQTLVPALPKLAMVTLGFPQLPITGAVNELVLNHW